MTTTTAETSAAGPTVTGAHPRLTVTGGMRAIAFYREVFGAELIAEPVIQADGRVGHAELRIGGLTVGLADPYPEMGFPSPTALGGTPIGISIEVASPAEVDQLFDRAVAAGAAGMRPPEDQFHGRRAGTVIDPFGHRWNISAPLG